VPNLSWLYIGVVYAAGVALARRCGVALPRRVAFLFYLLVLLFLFRPLTSATVNIATDVGDLISPWSASAPGTTKFTVSNHQGMDVVFQLAPWAGLVREKWMRLEPPLWNSQVGAGVPLLANMSSEGLSPLRLLVTPLPLGQLMTAAGALKLLVALTFTFLYCRRRFDASASVIGAIAFGFGGWMIVWLNFPQSTIGAFLPAVLLQIDLLAERVTFGRVAFAAALGPIVVFSGHPETAAHMTFYAALYLLLVVMVERPKPMRSFVAALAIASVAGVLMAAPVLFPFLETLRQSVRYEEVRHGHNVKGTPYSDLPSIIPMLQPRFQGVSPGPVWGPQNAETIAGFAGFVGAAAWFGLLARALLLRRFRTFEMALLIFTAIVFVLIDDWPVVSPPFRALFGLANNHRLRLMFCLLAAAMTAAVIHHARRERSTAAFTIAGGLALLAFLFLKAPFPDAASREIALRHAVPSVISLLLIAVIAMRVRVAWIALACSLLVELWLVGFHWNPVRPEKTLFPRTPLIETLLREQSVEPYRIAGIGGPLFPNTHTTFGLEDARVHDPMANIRYARFLQRTMKQYNPWEYYPKFNDSDSTALDYLNVRWLLTEPGVDLPDLERYRLLYDGGDGRLWENKRALPRFFAVQSALLTPIPDQVAAIRDWKAQAVIDRFPADARVRHDLLHPPAVPARVSIRRATPERYDLEIDASQNTLVVSSLMHFPGWRVQRDGVRLEPLLVNEAFIGFIVPPGKSRIRVDYVPLSFWGGVGLAIAAAASLFFARNRIARLEGIDPDIRQMAAPVRDTAHGGL
jgi:hypothetical protein